MKIKICGITNEKDALFAEQSGATYLGFILYPKSLRYIEPKAIHDIIQKLDSKINTVGVFVDESPEKVNKIITEIGLTHVQLHGEESVEDCKKINVPVIKAFRIATAKDLEEIPAYKNSVHAILLDTYVKGYSGGTGQSFNWNLAVMAKQFDIPLFLSGGLTPDTVQDAIHKVQPYGVDVSSGVEISPGQKDNKKVASFIQNTTK